MNPEERTRPRIRGVSREVQQVAKQMRRDMTPAERVLWLALRGGKLRGLRWRAQHPVGQFVLDFYCPACRLAVELDGAHHNAQQEQDAARTTFLQAYGCRVLRFPNAQVLANLDSVLQAIAEAVEFPPPRLGGPGGASVLPT
jgi:very-short-patch-repair endonuclease